MIFDKLCGIAERHVKEFRPILDAAKLFEFPGRAHDILPKGIDPKLSDMLMETFFLPFPVVAIEDTASCVVLVDQKPDQQGFADFRMFIECAPLDPRMASEYGDVTPEEAEAIKKGIINMPTDACIVRAGEIRFMGLNQAVLDGENMLYECRRQWFAVMTKSKIISPARVLDSNNELDQHIIQCGGRAAATALEEVYYFNAPDRFVVEKSSVANPRKSNLKIKRSGERPSYVLLTPKEIREKLIPAEAQAHGSTRQPHERRRHFRTLRSDRYVNAQGKTIVIPATWIGPDEGTVNGRRYKVRLDL
jgi:hypothetical protein